MKAVRAGKPIVLVPPPNHTEQGNNARRAVELGVAVALDQDNLKTETLVNAVRVSLEKNAGRALEISNATGGQGGASTVVHIVYHLAGN
jgi:UDP:flavonoid glycosyltransferase YjiC (YdhE family)